MALTLGNIGFEGPDCLKDSEITLSHNGAMLGEEARVFASFRINSVIEAEAKRQCEQGMGSVLGFLQPHITQISKIIKKNVGRLVKEANRGDMDLSKSQERMPNVVVLESAMSRDLKIPAFDNPKMAA